MTSRAGPRGLSVPDAMLLGTILIWSANVSFVKILLRYWSPFSLAAVRMLLACVAFAVIAAITERDLRVRREDLPLLGVAAFFGIFLNQAAFVFALTFTKASGVALLLSMIPVFVAVISAAIGLEPFSRWSLTGLPVSVVGVLLIVLAVPGAHLAIGTIQGDLFALGTALSWAAYTVALQPLLRKYTPARISFWVIAMGLVGLLPGAITTLDFSRISAAPWWSWGLVLYSSLGAIVTTNFLWYLGTHRLGPARGSLYAFLQPFLGAVAAVIILGDRIGPLELIGGGLVVLGIIIARRRSASIVDEQPGVLEAQ